MAKPRTRVRIRLRKGDMVEVIAGKDAGKRGRILKVIRERGRVIVQGVGFIKRHTRPNPQRNIKGGIVEREAAIHLSNVMLVDPDTNEPTRVGTKVLSDGTRVRVSRKSGQAIDK